MSDRIYLDHHAATPIVEKAARLMVPWLVGGFGNPGSIHREGQEAARAVSEAREAVGGLIRARPGEIVFTGSGTEANALALLGAARARRRDEGRAHLVTVATEHPSVLGPLRQLEAEGFTLTVVPVTPDGRVSVEAVAARCDRSTALASVAIAGYELGGVFDLAALSEVLTPLGVWLHTDAAIAPGWLDLDVGKLGVHLLSLSSHKLGGPKGAGALFVRRGCAVAALWAGGPQERGRRGGTEAVPALVGMGAAAQVAGMRGPAERQRVAALRERLRAGLLALGRPVRVNGVPELPGCLNVSFPGLEGEALALSLDVAGVAVSSGAACSSGTLEPAGPVVALGLGPDVERSSVRFSLGFETREDEIDDALRRIGRVVGRLDRLRGDAPEPVSA